MPLPTIINGYVSVERFMQAIGTADLSADDPVLDLYKPAIEGASRTVDDWTGRVFYTVTEARTFRATNRWTLDCGDFVPGSPVTVKTDENADGTFETTWTSGQYQAEPLVLVNGRPARQIIAATRTREFPIDSRRPRVEVTATWGWAAAPPEVAQATLALAVLLYRLKDLTGAEYGIELRTIDRPSGDPVAIIQSLVEGLAVPGGLLWKPPPVPGTEAA